MEHVDRQGAPSSPAGPAGSGWRRPASSAPAGPGSSSPTSNGRRSTRAVDELRADGVEAHGVVCDVRSLDAGHGARRRRVRRPRRACTSCSTTPASPSAARCWTMTHDDWRWVIDVDLWGPIHGVEAFLPRHGRPGRGRPRPVHGVVRRARAEPRPRPVLRRQVRRRGPRRGAVAGAARAPASGCRCCARCASGRSIGHSERNRSADYGGPAGSALVPIRTPATTTWPGGCSTSTASPRSPSTPSSPTACTCSRTRRAGRRSAAASSASTGRSTSRPRPAPAVLRRRSSR